MIQKRFNSLCYPLALIFIGYCSSAQAGFTTVSDDEWDNTAVRKVLHSFAYGGFASDTQIQTWADMPPAQAINQILSFAPTNDLLSPPQDNSLQPKLSVNGQDRTLEGVQTLWSSNTDPDNLMPAEYQYLFNPINSNGDNFEPGSLTYTWLAASNRRGINPFRQRVGFWLTNYHMAIHMNALDGNAPLLRTLYDESMALLGQGASFDQVLALGASSAAIAMQYGHMNNRYEMATGSFYGNDDFAREFHQLFFGILGVDPTQSVDADAFKAYYENITIENTAKALTGMQLTYAPITLPGADFSGYLQHIDFLSEENAPNHHAADLEILNFNNPGAANISGTTAAEKLQALAQLAINDPESELRLPQKIIAYFADDNLDARIETNPNLQDEITDAWRTSNKNLLDFLRAYAISTQFHSPQRIKYLTAFDRNLLILNQNTVDNQESYNSFIFPAIIARMQRQGATPFQPAHFVFGAQTAREAFENADIFKDAYNSNICIIQGDSGCSDSWATLARTGNSTTGWEKNWAALIPTNANNTHDVDSVARWLWNRFVADGGAYYGPQERAHITSLLATGEDFLSHVAQQTGEPFQEDGLASADLLNPDLPYLAVIEANEAITLPLLDPDRVYLANQRIGLAVNFITATPYMFAQVGR